MPTASIDIVANPERLNALYETELLDSPPEEAFDRLTRLASRIVKAPVALVSLVDGDRQFFKSAVGLPDPWASDRETPLSHSFCQHVVATGKNLIVSDARQHPLVFDNLAIPDLNVIGYLGIPLIDSSGHGLGSFCVIDGQPREWSEDEIEILKELSKSVMTEIELRKELRQRKCVELELQKVNKSLDTNNRHLNRITEFAASTIDYTLDAVQRGANESEILSYLGSARHALSRRNFN